MATRSVVRHLLRLAGCALAAGVLAAGSILLPAVPLQASTSAAQDSATPLRGAPQAGLPLREAPSTPLQDTGIIAYVDRMTTDVHVVLPNGSNDRVLWTSPQSEYKFLELDLAWRPDGRELAFTSTHENACSWYDSDIYTISYLGTRYRRITNSPACAALAAMPQGSVTVNVTNYTGDLAWVYVAGAPSVKTIIGSGVVTFDTVADFGPGVYQPSIGVWGLYRFTSYPPYADVEPGKTLPGGNITFSRYGGFQAFGAGKISWRADGSALAYVLRSNRDLYQISANPPYNNTGAEIAVNPHAKPNLVAWGPTPATANKYLYVSGSNLLDEGYHGIWLTSAGDASGGEQLVNWDDYSGPTVQDIEWLPDGSGFLVSLFYVGLGYFVDIFRYDFETGESTQLTNFPADVDLTHDLSISPDGRQVVFDREADRLDEDGSVWIMNIDGSNVHKLVDHAGKPAWGRTVEAPSIRAYLPLTVRSVW